MQPKSLVPLLLSGLNEVSATKYDTLPVNLTIEQIGLDSISLSQLVLFIEDELGYQIPDAMLIDIAKAETVGDVAAAFAADQVSADDGQ